MEKFDLIDEWLIYNKLRDFLARQNATPLFH